MDAPLLTNRKLRNLTSISLRNLSLTPTSTPRKRGKTIDDDALPQTLQSPAKLVALREQRVLEHSRSSEDLNALSREDPTPDALDGVAVEDGSPLKEKRGIVGGSGNISAASSRRPELRRRRRSTLEWDNATPQRRQERLENVTKERMMDVFFGLHVEGVEEPIYVSEMVEKTMNPTFRHIDLSACGPGITRMDVVKLKIWVRQVTSERWRQLLNMDIGLRDLQYFGKSLDHLPTALPKNAVLLHLPDGVYSPIPTFPPSQQRIPPAPTRQSSIRPLQTSSFDALLRLSKLDDSIQDALSVRNGLASDLETLLLANKEALSERDNVPEAEDRLKTIEYAKKTVERQLEKARKQTEEKRSSLSTRRQLMASDLTQRKTQSEWLQTTRPELPHLRAERETKRKAIQNQRRRICEDLAKIYPIAPIPGQPLAFTIRGLHLPNSDALDGEPPETISAALGYVSHILLLLSHYLAHPLIYPVRPQGSTSTIEDPISLLKTSTSHAANVASKLHLTADSSTSLAQSPQYPLFSKYAPRFKHEYAVFLLNKDLQILLESVYDVRVQDLRHTLVNLKYLFYVATAGEGELPARKVGGVKGLMKSGGTSRSGSVASDGSTGVNLNGGLSGVGAVESLRRNIGPRVGSGGKRGAS